MNTNSDLLKPLSWILLAQIIFWYRGNAKALYGLDWGPLQWWMTTSLITNYLTLYAWWRMTELTNVWKAGAYWGCMHVLVDLTLNSIYFGVSIKGILALLLVGLASIIIH